MAYKIKTPKRYEATFMIDSIELDAKSEKEARRLAIKMYKEDLDKKEMMTIEEI